jgi:hypothetical protein
VRVRKFNSMVISTAINKQAIIDGVHGGTGVSA